MPTTEMSPEAALFAAEMIPADTPIFVLNLLRYREQADYGDRTDALPCSGREAYFGRYVPAFNKAVGEQGIKGIQPLYLGAVMARLVGPPDEEWDNVAIVEYPSFAAFRRATENPQYQAEALHHRSAALEDLRLIATTKIAL